MSLPLVFRPVARRELDEAISWYEKQKVGLGLELEDATSGSAAMQAGFVIPAHEQLAAASRIASCCGSSRRLLCPPAS
jgi:hypothetical protein